VIISKIGNFLDLDNICFFLDLYAKLPAIIRVTVKKVFDSFNVELPKGLIKNKTPKIIPSVDVPMFIL